MTVTAEEIDRAIRARKFELTRGNARVIKCAHCRQLCQPGEARRLWIDGFKRGFLCLARCCKGLKKYG